jgi:hypothetical protein
MEFKYTFVGKNEDFVLSFCEWESGVWYEDFLAASDDNIKVEANLTGDQILILQFDDKEVEDFIQKDELYISGDNGRYPRTIDGFLLAVKETIDENAKVLENRAE